MNKWINEYDYILVSSSGGKDSFGCLVECLRSVEDKGKIELWHQCIDGKNCDTNYMDWPVTEDYFRKVAVHLKIKFYFQWKQGGFYREMHRENQLTAPTQFENDQGKVITVGGIKGKLNTRKLFPQVSADLKTRWCSAYLKIDVMATSIRNQKRFEGKKILVVTGERAEESSSRAKYKEFEVDRSDARNGKKDRHVDHWRPVHKWQELQIWEAMERHNIIPHPAYRLGWGRLSCMACIFGSCNQWASIKKITPKMAERIIDDEFSFGKTIQRNSSVPEMIEKGKPYNSLEPELVAMALSKAYTDCVVSKQKWKLPAGAFGENNGPI